MIANWSGTGPDFTRAEWRTNNEKFNPTNWRCVVCGNTVGGEPQGWQLSNPGGLNLGRLRICNVCKFPTPFGRDDQPAFEAAYGRSVRHVPAEVEQVYEEARACLIVKAYSAVILLCRKLLMHLAHDFQDDTQKAKKQS